MGAFMEEDLGLTVFQYYFLGLFLCAEENRGLATKEDRMSRTRRIPFEMYLLHNFLTEMLSQNEAISLRKIKI